MPEHRVTQWALYVIAAAIGGLLVVGLVSLPTSAALEQPIRITSCAPAGFDGEECADGATVDPDTLVLTAELSIEAVGTVCADETAAYDPVTVDWVSLESDARFRVLEFPVTWDEGCTPYPVQTWVPPTQLLEMLDGVEPGTDLGRWRIVGTATPVRADKFSPYQWDSVDTFRLTAGE